MTARTPVSAASSIPESDGAHPHRAAKRSQTLGQCGLRVPIAVLPWSVDRLLRRYAIEFTAGVDDLDAYQIPFSELQPGQQAMLLEYHGDESGSITVSVDSRDFIEEAEAHLLRCFNLTTADTVWLKSANSELSHA